MLKPESPFGKGDGEPPAAFRRLCVETNVLPALIHPRLTQPPSGGCVLKPMSHEHFVSTIRPAAFRRLCVETLLSSHPRGRDSTQPPSGGCVLKQGIGFEKQYSFHQPPSGGCVLKRFLGRLYAKLPNQPPSGGCVLKR